NHQKKLSKTTASRHQKELTRSVLLQNDYGALTSDIHLCLFTWLLDIKKCANIFLIMHIF
ncbi:hypothetical protein MKX03_006233, partial [Papaver bracteatum]